MSPKVISCVPCGNAVRWPVQALLKDCEQGLWLPWKLCTIYMCVYVCVFSSLSMHAHVSFSDLEHQKYPSGWKDTPSPCGFLERPLIAGAELCSLSARAVLRQSSAMGSPGSLILILSLSLSPLFCSCGTEPSLECQGALMEARMPLL